MFTTRIKLIYGGNEYVSKATDEMTAEKMRDAIYENFSDMNKFTIEMENGFIVVGKDVVQSSVIIIEEI